MKTRTNSITATLALALLGTAATAHSPTRSGEMPLAYQIALQGDHALLQIERANWRSLRQLKPMPLELVVREDAEIASE